MASPAQGSHRRSSRVQLERAAAAEAQLATLLAQPDRDAARALDAAIAAATLYMAARRAATDAGERQALDAKCTALLDTAEALKAEKKKTATPPPPPRRGRPLTVREETLLLKSSRVNGLVFPPWPGAPAAGECEGAAFSDPAGLLPLSAEQAAMLHAWRRPADIHGPAARLVPQPGCTTDLAQDVITDCSVVASLCAGVRREERGFGSTVTGVLYPQQQGVPVPSPSGKYIVKLYFNGCFRRVVVDDLLPTTQSARKLHVTCRNQPSLYGYSLIEKAYLKLMGGYDFPGSNSGTDLLALTGWIPEHIFLQSDDVVLGSLWKRMLKAWGSGDVLITLGTGHTTKREEKELGLIGEHDYTVLDLKEEDGDRMMLVKNPWTEGTVWRGAPNDQDSDDDDADFDGPTLAEAEAAAVAKRQRESAQRGVFWISLENVSRNFASVYLNWNPALFTHRHDAHFAWDLSSKLSETAFGQNPQFALTNAQAQPATVWIHLSRHLGLGSEGTTCHGFISLYLFDTGGQKVYLSSGFLERASYVDSPQTLLRIDNFPAKTTYTLVVSSQDLTRTTHHFSLSVLSLSPVAVSAAAETHPHATSLHGCWTAATSGGNAHSPDYARNPQFTLTLPAPASVLLLLEATGAAAAHPVHVKLVHSAGGRRIAGVTQRDIIAESGEYRRATALARARELPAGAYTALASTFEPRCTGPFVLTLRSTAPGAAFAPLPPEGAGMFVARRAGAWAAAQRRVGLGLAVARLGRGWVRARTRRGSGFALRIALSRVVRGEKVLLGELGDGEFSDAPQGVRTAEVDLERGEYAVVLERMGRGEGEWEVEVVSDGVVQLDEVPK